MNAAVQWADPGVVGFTAGGLLILLALGLALFGARRVRDEVRAEVGSAGPPPGYWHPSMGPRTRRPEPVTELLPRCVDAPDATLLIPRQRAVRRG